MTKLTGNNPVTRKTAATYRRRFLAVRLEAHRLLIWEQRSRRKFEIDYPSVYEAAMKLAYLREKAEKTDARIGRRKNRK